MRKSLWAAAVTLASVSTGTQASDLFEGIVVGVEKSIYQEPPSNPLAEVSGSAAHTINCTMRMGAGIGYSGTPTTGDLDDLSYYTSVQCSKPAGTAAVGRTGITKQIKRLMLCTDPDLDGFCTTIHTATAPPATTSDTVSATGEFDSDFLVVDALYYVIAQVTVSNPNTDFYWASSTGLPAGQVNFGSGWQDAWNCVKAPATNSYECTIISLPFRYLP